MRKSIAPQGGGGCDADGLGLPLAATAQEEFSLQLEGLRRLGELGGSGGLRRSHARLRGVYTRHDDDGVVVAPDGA